MSKLNYFPCMSTGSWLENAKSWPALYRSVAGNQPDEWAVSLILPPGMSRNFGEARQFAAKVAEQIPDNALGYVPEKPTPLTDKVKKPRKKPMSGD